MPLLFRLRAVPEDEAEEIRALLAQHDIGFRETSGGFLGLGTAAIWVDGADEFSQATALLNQYQESRFAHAQAQYEADQRSGDNETLWQSFTNRPIQFLVYIVIALAIMYFSLQPFFGLK